MRKNIACVRGPRASSICAVRVRAGESLKGHDMREMNAGIKAAAGGFAGLAKAAGEKREPTEAEIVEAFSGALAFVTIATDALVRIAEAVERLEIGTTNRIDR